MEPRTHPENTTMTYAEPSLTDLMYYPGTYSVVGSIAIDEIGNREIVHWVVIPVDGIGRVAWYTSPADAVRLARAYNEPGATRETILRARAAIGHDDGWAVVQLAELGAT
jgi:hypothetical protein